MNDFFELVRPLRRAVFPLCFESGNKEYPFSTFGTCFLIELECGFFAVTMKHVVGGTHVSDLFIFEEADQIELIKFDRLYDVECVNFPHSEISDLVLLRIDRRSITNKLACYNLSKIPNSWESDPWNYNYMVFGYPTVDRLVDFDKKHINTIQYNLSGSFQGKSMLEDCYKLKVDKGSTEVQVELDGYSGSPVFAWPKNNSDIYKGVLCGVAIQGSGNTVNFIRRREIDAIAAEICS